MREKMQKEDKDLLIKIISEINIGDEITYYSGYLAKDRLDCSELDNLANYVYRRATGYEGSGEFELFQIPVGDRKNSHYRLRRIKYAG